MNGGGGDTMVAVAAHENEECIQLPTANDGSLKKDVVLSAFPESIGLAYKCIKTDGWKLVKEKNETFIPPDTRWSSRKFIPITGKRIKFKLRNVKLNEKSLQAYFSKYGIAESPNINKKGEIGFITVRFITDAHLENIKQQEHPFILEEMDRPNPEKFSKRSGTTNLGNKFEELTIASLLLNLTLDGNIKNFYLSSNDEEFGSFDDIVLDVELTDGNTCKYAIQLKYSNDDGQLKQALLTSVKGNFSIQKYFKDFLDMIEYTKSYNLILFTNLKFNKQQTLKLENSNIQLKILKEKTPKEFGNDFCYKFQLDSPCTLKYQTFFENFFLYPNQPNTRKIEANILKIFNEQLNCPNIDYYLKFISEWSNKSGNKTRLNKELVKEIITLQVLFPKIVSFQFVEKENNTNTELLKEAICNFNITVVDEAYAENVVEMWENVTEDSEKVEKIVNERHLNNLNDDKKRVVALWIMNKCPLIITESAATYSVANLCFEKKFILLKNTPSISRNLKIFIKLSDLKTNNFELYEKIIKSFQCLVQGKKVIDLEYFIKHNEGMKNLITLNELVQMLNGPLVIGKKETILDIYIDRLVTRLTVDCAFFDQINEDTLVVISCQGNFDKLKNSFKNINLVDVENYLDEEQNENFVSSKLEQSNFEKTVYVSKHYCDRAMFNTVCNKNRSKKKCHHFKLVDGGIFEWTYGRGEISDLQKYKTCSHFIKEEDLISNELESGINIITADPGMGKTELMKKLTNNYPPLFWTSLIPAKDWSEYFRREDCDNEDFIHRIINNCKTNFEKELLKMMHSKNKIVFLWDGLDELSDIELNNVIRIIDRFSKNDSKQWITCRRHLEGTLENKFNVLSRTIAPFDDKEQRRYIHRRLDETGYHLKIEDVIRKIKDYINNVQYNEILGIPLQIFMLTELFLKDPEKINVLLNEIFSITDLYKHFIEMKFEIFFKEKSKLSDFNFPLQNILTIFQKEQLTYHQRAALSVTLEYEFLKELNVGTSFDDLETVYGMGIIIEKTEENKPKFLHFSYAEYLVALYLYEYRHKHGISIKEHIFHENYRNIRVMFDFLLAKKCPTHLAILCRNIEYLKHCQDYSCKDEGGRNPLQIACSWGTVFPLLTTEKRDNVLLIDNDKAKLINVSEHDEMINLLLEHNNITEQDELFGMTATDYADLSLSFKALMEILKHGQSFSFEKLRNFNDIGSVLYYSVKLDCEFALSKNKNIPFVKIMKHGYSLLHLACVNNSIKCVRILLNQHNYRSQINDKQNEYGETPVLMASRDGHHHIVKCLIASEADVNIPQQDGLLPIHAAAGKGHLQVVKLLTSKSDVNAKSKRDLTPIYLASRDGHCHVVEFLAEAGAEVNLSETDGTVPIHIAAINGHLEVVKLLLRLKSDVNAKSKKGFTPIYLAAQEGHLEVVKFLVQAGADVNITQRGGSAPIHAAAHNGHVDVVKFLVDLKVDVDAKTGKGVTPVYMATQKGRYDVVKCLLESGADVNIKHLDALHSAVQNGHFKLVKFFTDLKVDVNARSRKGYTPVYLAAREGYCDVARLLIKSGANINIPEDNGFLPIHIAAVKGHIEMVKLLISLADLNVECSHGTPIYLASREGHFDVVKCLAESGADVNIPKQYGFVPIHTAALRGHFEIIKLLISLQVDVNARAVDGSTPILLAALNGHYEAVKCLVESGADVNVADQNDSLPIHVAAENGHVDVVKLLVDLKVDLNARTNKGCTPVCLAALKGHCDVVKLLVDSGADLNIPQRDGYVPIHAAVFNGHVEMVELLMDLRVDVDAVADNGLTPISLASQKGHHDVVKVLEERSRKTCPIV